jgi:hypothetical protein
VVVKHSASALNDTRNDTDADDHGHFLWDDHGFISLRVALLPDKTRIGRQTGHPARLTQLLLRILLDEPLAGASGCGQGIITQTTCGTG